MRTVLVAALLVAALGSACDSDDDATNSTIDSTPTPPQATATATPLAPPSAGLTLLAESITVNAAPVRTGNADVDATIRAMEAHDVDTLLARLFHVDYACGTAACGGHGMMCGGMPVWDACGGARPLPGCAFRRRILSLFYAGRVGAQ